MAFTIASAVLIATVTKLQGDVIDEGGKPVAALVVMTCSMAAPGAEPRRVVTDVAGHFEIPLRGESGACELRAATEKASVERGTTVMVGPHVFKDPVIKPLVLAPATITFRGTLKNSASQPVRGWVDASYFDSVVTVATRDDGTFEVPYPARAKAIVLTPRAAGYGSVRIRASMNDGPSDGVITLPSAGVVNGQVVGSDGQSVMVCVQDEVELEGVPLTLFCGHAASDGSFSLASMAPGGYVVTAATPRLVADAQVTPARKTMAALTVKAGLANTLKLTLPTSADVATLDVSVRARWNSPHELKAFLVGEDQRDHCTALDDRKTPAVPFQFKAVPSGRYVLTFVTNNRTAWAETIVVTSDKRSFDFNVPLPGTVTVRVFDEQDKGVAMASGSLAQLGHLGGARVAPLGKSGPDGLLTYPFVASTVPLSLWVKYGWQGSMTLELAALTPGEDRVVDVHVKNGTTIYACVKGRDGAPAAGVTLWLKQSGGLYSPYETDAQGCKRVRWLGASQYTISASESHAQLDHGVSTVSSTVDLNMTDGEVWQGIELQLK